MSVYDLCPITGRNPLLWSAVDGWVLCRRNLVKTFRAPRLLIALTAQPVILVLLFTYVFGGAFDMGPGLDYGGFVLPGLLVQGRGARCGHHRDRPGRTASAAWTTGSARCRCPAGRC